MMRFLFSLICLLSAEMALAQTDSRQPNGPVDLRVDGRANKREGVPPNAADKALGAQQNDIRNKNCAAVAKLNSIERPDYQASAAQSCN